MNLTDQYPFFFDDDLFVETDRPGFRRRVIIGDHLELRFWRIKGGDVVQFDAASGLVVVDKTLTAPIVHATTLITNAWIEGRIGRRASSPPLASATRCSSATSTGTTCRTCRSSSRRRRCSATEWSRSANAPIRRGMP